MTHFAGFIHDILLWVRLQSIKRSGNLLRLHRSMCQRLLCSVSKLQFWRFACDAGLLPNNAPRHEIDAVFNSVVCTIKVEWMLGMAFAAVN